LLKKQDTTALQCRGLAEKNGGGCFPFSERRKEHSAAVLGVLCVSAVKLNLGVLAVQKTLLLFLLRA
jgi:hypothetical protein